MKQWAASAGGVALWAGLTAVACAQAPAAGQGIYTCVDKHGRRITADRPIQECLDREQRELSPSGITRRQIGPSLSDTERAALEAQQRKEAEERVRAIEEKRRERALVARYPDKATHDIERNAALQQQAQPIARQQAQQLFAMVSQPLLQSGLFVVDEQGLSMALEIDAGGVRSTLPGRFVSQVP